MEFFTYQEIKDNLYGNNSWSFDVVSIYNAFLKIFKVVLDENTENYQQLTTNYFTRNDRFKEVAENFSFYMFKFLSSKKFLDTDEIKTHAFNKIQQLFKQDKSQAQENKNFAEIIANAKTIFRLTKLDGNILDITYLIDSFDFISESKLQKIKLMSFALEPFNGCDIPS
ncbi:hypothetical protein [Mycoplasma leonicaptivi]|uniref:hypothetical protein n=1 Tax=Mycoplasma leonicaptivi TaxID=36742 RepID=UPI00047FF4D7|nr:hypothetical protein [Mycoplasma leonicaptivi]